MAVIMVTKDVIKKMAFWSLLTRLMLKLAELELEFDTILDLCYDNKVKLNLKKPQTETELFKKWKGFIAWSTLSRRLNEMLWYGLISYINIDGRTKLWKLKKLEVLQ